MDAIFLNSDSGRVENSCNSDSESRGKDEDFTSESGHKEECTESSIESKMQLSTDEEICREGKRTHELQLMSMTFNGRFIETSIHLVYMAPKIHLQTGNYP